ncbi:group II intron maturase-specific domain-containing protein [Streptomyces chiangmaiensis]
MRHARDRIREITDRSRLLLPVEVVVAELNRFLTGWAGYFRFGNSADRFAVIREFTRMRMVLFVAKKHKRSRGFGRWVVSYASPDRLGLVGLAGNVVAPRPFRDWRGSRMPPVNSVGEPGAGEPHARIEVAGAGNGARKQVTATGVAQPTGKPAEERPQVLPPAEATAPVPDPT